MMQRNRLDNVTATFALLFIVVFVLVALSGCVGSPAPSPAVTEYYATVTAGAITETPQPEQPEPTGTLEPTETPDETPTPDPPPVVWPTWTPVPTIAPPPDASIHVSDVVSQPATYEVAATYNIRSEPYVGATVVGSASPGYAYSVVQLASVVFASGEYQEWLHINEVGWVVYYHTSACGGFCGELTLDYDRPKLGYQSEVVRPFDLEQDNANFCLPFMGYGMQDYQARYQQECPDAVHAIRVFDENCTSDYTCVRSQQGWMPPEQGVAQLIEQHRWHWADMQPWTYVQLVDNETHAPVSNRAAFWSDFSAWQIEVLEQLNDEQMAALLGNFSVGTPAIAEWQYMVPMLQACADAGPDRCAVNLHEYAAACDWQVGYPWYVGRWQLAAAEWQRLGVEPLPAIVIGEAGFDFVGGGVPWSLCGDAHLVPPGTGVSAWYAGQMIDVDETWQRSDLVVAGYLFIRGHVSPQWQGFHVEGEVTDRLRDYFESLEE